MTIYLSLLVALIGLLIHVIATNPKLQPLGIPTYFAGLLAFLLTGAEPMIKAITK